MTVKGLVSSLSVRTRIIVLAVIPLLGFLATGVVATLGEAQVERALGSVKRATALADVAQDFKSALMSMRVRARDFGTHPSHALVKDFEASHAAALASLDRIEGALDPGERQKLIPLRSRLSDIIGNLADLVHNHPTQYASVTFNHAQSH